MPTVQSPALHQRDIFRFWFPLFASWLLMSAEGPVISAAINRLPNEVLMLAAQGIVLSLSVTIESPIINLLATTTALARDRQSYLLIRRFTLHWIAGLTIVAFLVAFTGLFDVVVPGWLGAPADVAEWVRPGMQIMLLWTAAIGWRRFCQGLLIRFNQTRKIAWGTLIRLTASGGVAIGLAVWNAWPGVVIGATALMAGVVAEAIYATIAVRPVVRDLLGPNHPPAEGAPLTYRALFAFHLPLAGTSFLLLLVQPLVTFSLSRLDNPTQTLAAWPLVYQFMLVARAAAFALPEVAIALTRGPETLQPMRRFALRLAVVLTLIVAAISYTPLVDVYLFAVQDATPAIGNLARQGLYFFLFLPALTVLISWLRGLLINTGATKIVNLAMAANLLATAALLFAGARTGLPAFLGPALALNGAHLLELFVVWRGAQGSLRRIANRPPEAAALAST
jgi:hypothetical protein